MLRVPGAGEMSISPNPAFRGAGSCVNRSRSARVLSRNIRNPSSMVSPGIYSGRGMEDCVTMTKILRWVVLAAAVSGSLSAQEKKSPLTGPIVYLWEKEVPLAQGTDEKNKPNLSLYLAPTGTP